MRFIFIYFTSIQFNKKFKNNISPKFNSKDYSKLFISDQFNSKFNSKLWNWLDSIQQNIHSIWKCGYRSGLSVGHKKCWENSRNVGPKNDPKMQIWSFCRSFLVLISWKSLKVVNPLLQTRQLQWSGLLWRCSTKSFLFSATNPQCLQGIIPVAMC